MATRVFASWLVVVGALLRITSSAHPAQAALDDEERTKAIALGQRCQAPMVRIADKQGEFDVYVESPFARAALAAATATMMRWPIDAPGVRTAMQSGYRIWVDYSDRSLRRVSIGRVAVRRRGGAELRPASVRSERFSVGTVPSHGIVEALRARFPEFIFADLPSNTFDIVLYTNVGIRRYAVTAKARSTLMRVCN